MLMIAVALAAPPRKPVPGFCSSLDQACWVDLNMHCLPFGEKTCEGKLACVSQYAGTLSEKCHALLAPHLEAERKWVAEYRLYVRKECQPDIKRHCSAAESGQDPAVPPCLIGEKLSARCRKAISPR